ncbi:hypothetical protein FTV88_0759 [Heliorestis convoluta]|uniref:Uncharacterized protein n=1 Tax=Heliorestis convoluta TaxID=356322 RepID=A0A5Q2N095_9FIRM|nr:hypothetical protein FTV88_0759 [Heliorestis convoluta]
MAIPLPFLLVPFALTFITLRKRKSSELIPSFYMLFRGEAPGEGASRGET